MGNNKAEQFHENGDTRGSLEARGKYYLPRDCGERAAEGGIVFTLVGPNDYPSAAFVPVNNTSVGGVQIARAGNEPDDGFSGYPELGGNGIARWGDYSAGAIDTDGVIWMATEYAPDIARTVLTGALTLPGSSDS
jgi:hypothetical protein